MVAISSSNAGADAPVMLNFQNFKSGWVSNRNAIEVYRELSEIEVKSKEIHVKPKEIHVKPKEI